MNIEHLKYFVLVADSLNITHTAKNYTFRSRHLATISNLEKIRCKLFERVPALKLTYAGEVLYKSC